MTKRVVPSEPVTLGERVKALRKAKSLSAEKLARQSASSISTIRRLEAGLQYPKVDRMAAIARALGTTVSELTAGTELDTEHEQVSA